jgi:hypothetical protein
MPIAIINRVIGDDQHVKRHLPTVWLKQQHQAEIKKTPENEGVVISCSKIQKKKNGMLDVKTITSTFIIRHQAGMPAKALDPTRALVEVGNFFSFLHAPLVETSLFNDILELPVLSPREYFEMRCRLLRGEGWTRATGGGGGPVAAKFEYTADPKLAAVKISNFGSFEFTYVYSKLHGHFVVEYRIWPTLVCPP